VLVPHSPDGMLLLLTWAPAECHSEAGTFLRGRCTFLPAACKVAETDLSGSLVVGLSGPLGK